MYAIYDNQQARGWFWAVESLRPETAEHQLAPFIPEHKTGREYRDLTFFYSLGHLIQTYMDRFNNNQTEELKLS